MSMLSQGEINCPGYFCVKKFYFLTMYAMRDWERGDIYEYAEAY